METEIKCASHDCRAPISTSKDFYYIVGGGNVTICQLCGTKRDWYRIDKGILSGLFMIKGEKLKHDTYIKKKIKYKGEDVEYWSPVDAEIRLRVNNNNGECEMYWCNL